MRLGDPERSARQAIFAGTGRGSAGGVSENRADAGPARAFVRAGLEFRHERLADLRELVIREHPRVGRRDARTGAMWAGGPTII